MLEPKSVEAYLEWRLLHPLEAAELDWNSQGGYHSELLGYVRWCKLKLAERKDYA
jgi:hypothetical protein